MQIKSERVPHFSDMVKPGQFTFYSRSGVEGHAGLTFLCPCGCGAYAGVRFNSASEYGWNWDGNEELPTVTPSILRLDGCKWHGYLTAGFFVGC